MNFKRFDYKLWTVLIFVVLYSLFIFLIDYTWEDYTEVLAASVFFFTLFTSFFISRQNDRFCKAYDIMAEQDSIFSYLYRMAGFFPEIQDRVREITINHYLRIKKSGDWGYHINNPSTSITDLTYAFGEIDNEPHLEKAEKPAMSAGAEIIWDGIKDLQLIRKKLVVLKHQKLLFFQWIIIYILAFILIVSFGFIPTPEGFTIELLKIIFGTTVFLVLILLKQLNDLSLFGRNFAQKIADDVLWVVEEKDKEAVGILDDVLKEKIKKTREKVEREVGL